MATDVLNAIGQLWEVVLIVSILIVVILFRTEIRGLINRIKFIKFGNREIRTTDEDSQKPIDSAVQHFREEKSVDDKKNSTDSKSSEKSGIDAMMSAFMESDFRRADDAYKDTIAELKDYNERRKIEATYLYFRYSMASDNNALVELSKLSSQDPPIAEVTFYLGMCYLNTKEYSMARKTFEEARNLANEVFGAQITSNIADCWSKEGDPNKGIDEVIAQIRQAQETNAKVQLYLSLGSLYQAIDSERMRSVALEKALELAPNATHSRFDAAYSESNAKFTALSARNYDTLLTLDPKDANALNNLGVECGRTNLQFKSIDYYRKAEREGSTLAMANLAQALMQAGFHEEAAEKLSEARQMEYPHENVALVHADLERKRQEEEEAWAKLLKIGTRQQRFLREFAQASIDLPAANPFLGTWEIAGGHVSHVHRNGNQISVEFLYKGVRRKLEATTLNGSAEGKLWRRKIGLLNTEGSYGDAVEALAAVGSGGMSFSILELSASSTLIRMTRSA